MSAGSSRDRNLLLADSGLAPQSSVEPEGDEAFDFHENDLLSLDDESPGSVGGRAGSVNDPSRVRGSMPAEPQDLTELMGEYMPYGATLGIDSLRGSADEVEATLAWAPQLCTAGGVLHGGALMALADSAGAVCAFLNLPSGARTVTIESKTNFFGAIKDGSVRARSRPLHRGRTTIVVETDLFDANDRHVGRTTQTQAVLPAA
jgi:1,4-dihydroxy-2-naphthoyl-CoA hydrolase